MRATERGMFLAAALLFGAAFVVLLPSLRGRLAWEKNKTVELCVDGRELWALSRNNGAVFGGLLERLSRAGVASVAVYWDGEKLDPGAGEALPDSLAVVFRPALPGFSPGLPPLPTGLPAERTRTKTRHLLFAGLLLPDYPRLTTALEWIARTSWSLPWVEFSRQAGLGAVAQKFPERLLRAHSVDEEEMAKSTPPQILARFRRAARERGIRFFYVRFFPALGGEDNIRFVESLAGLLRDDGFVLERARPFFETAAGKGVPAGGSRGRGGAAFFAAVVLPVLFFAALLRKPHPLFSPLLLMFLSLAGGLFVAALLSTPAFALGLERFRGVKLALVAPLVIAALRLFSWRDIIKGMERPLTVGWLLAGAGVTLVLALFVLRSGHEGPVGAGGLELKIRAVLESVFVVRPRFKEFVVGFPLLWLGFYLIKTKDEMRNTKGETPDTGYEIRNTNVLTRVVLLGGLIGPVSVINTFCHPHVPLAVSLLRTLHGFWLGSLGGLALIVFYRLLKKNVPSF